MDELYTWYMKYISILKAVKKNNQEQKKSEDTNVISLLIKGKLELRVVANEWNNMREIFISNPCKELWKFSIPEYICRVWQLG